MPQMVINGKRKGAQGLIRAAVRSNGTSSRIRKKRQSIPQASDMMVIENRVGIVKMKIIGPMIRVG